MNKTGLRLILTGLAVIVQMTGAALSYATQYHSTNGGSITMYQADGITPVTATTPYSPKATCARACHLVPDGVEFAGHNYGSGDKYSTHVQGVLASGTDSTVYWEASQTKSFDHGVSVGKHMNQGRNETYTNAYRAKFGDPFFTSSPGMFGKY